MDFMEAVKAMEKGKKVKRECWTFICFKDKNDKIKSLWPLTKDKQDYKLDMVDYNAKDWEVVEEKKKTLSDKLESTKKGVCDNSEYCYKEDIKEFIKDIYHYTPSAICTPIEYSTEVVQKVMDQVLLNVRLYIKRKVGERLL